MARGRRKNKTTRRKYKSAVNIKNAALSYLTLNAATQTAFNTNPQQFFLGGFLGSNYFGSASGGSSSAVTLQELLKGVTLGSQGQAVRPVTEDIQKNIKDNLGSGIMMILGLQVANKLITKLGVSRSFNKAVRSVGMGDLVKM
jgi:hypothetical protein